MNAPLPADPFRSIFEHSIDAILLATPEGEFLAANPEACRMFGRSQEEMCTLGRPAILDPDDPQLLALLTERDRTGAFRGELLFKRKDGSRFPGEISSAFYLDPSGRKLASVTIRDVSHRKRAERLTAAEHAVTRVLAECATLAEAAPRLLHAVCENLGWASGALWRVSSQQISAHACKVLTARGARSPRFPIGVLTSHNSPVTRAAPIVGRPASPIVRTRRPQPRRHTSLSTPATRCGCWNAASSALAPAIPCRTVSP